MSKNKNDITVTSMHELRQMMPQLNAISDPSWKEKLIGILTGAQSEGIIETFGRYLSAPQFVAVLEYYAETEKADRAKLYSVLIGLREEIFVAVLADLAPPALQLLQKEAGSEPVQHRLLVMCHLFSSIIDLNNFEVVQLKEKILKMDPQDIGGQDLKQMMDSIDQIAQVYKDLLAALGPALTIAWNSGRTDLVDQLSSVKESCMRSFIEHVGGKQDDWDNELHVMLARQLNSAYGDPDNPLDIEALHDDEQAIAVLPKLGIWYPRDYFEVGLLPHLKSIDDVALDPKIAGMEKCVEYRDHLVNSAQENIRQMGLNTVKDMREAGIFSRKSFAEYIKKKLKKKK